VHKASENIIFWIVVIFPHKELSLSKTTTLRHYHADHSQTEIFEFLRIPENGSLKDLALLTFQISVLIELKCLEGILPSTEGCQLR
jgi:hypothetical protein